MSGLSTELFPSIALFDLEVPMPFRPTRRAFLVASGALTASALLSFPRRARAQAALPPLLVTVEAKGGWDPTYFCDPVADPLYSFFAAEHVLQAGNVRYAPHTVDGMGAHPYAVAGGADFFAKHHAHLTVINGVDNQTVSHLVGPRVAFAGTNRPGLPTLDALVAAALDPDAALALVTAGGQVSTEGLVPLTLGSDFGLIESALASNATNPGNPSDTGRFQLDVVHDLVRERQRARDARLALATVSPREAAFVTRVQGQRDEEMIARFSTLRDAFAEITETSSGNEIADAAQGVLAAMRAGECGAAHLVTRGFDSHGNHDSFNNRTGHRPGLLRLFVGLDVLLDGVLADPTLLERGVIVVVASDFARTIFNGEAGKDHWPVTSLMVFALGAAAPLCPGDRVLGFTDPFGEGGEILNGLRARKVLVEDATLVPTDDADPSGISVTSSHVHVALRDLLTRAGVDPTGVFSRFPIPGADPAPLPFFPGA